MSGTRRSRVAANAILGTVVVAGITALWSRFNVLPPGVGRPFPHDLVYYFLPQLDQVGQRLASLELPLWNPDPCTGLPLLASMQVAVFYPTTWLSAFVPADELLPIIVFVHLLLGGAACALLFRTWGLAPSLAGAFGVVFAFACLLGQSFWPPEVVTLSWLPFLLLCTERVMAGQRADGWWLGLVVGTALQLLAGFPQFVVYGLQLLVPFALLRGVQRRKADGNQRAALSAAGRVIAALALGTGVAMVQLAPSFEVLSSSQRLEPFSEQEVHYLRAQKQGRLPRLLENAVDPAPRLTTYELGQGTGYLGIGTLVLAGVALMGRRRDPLVWCLAGAGGVFLVLSDGYLGIGSEIYRVYAMLPAIGLFRAPERLLSAAFLCFIALAALGAGALDRAASESRLHRTMLGATAAAMAIGVGASGGSDAAWRGGVALACVLSALWVPLAPRSRSAWRGIAALLLVADVVAATGAFGSLRDLPDGFARRMRAGPHEIVSATELDSIRRDAGHSRVEFVAPGMQIRPLMGVGEAGGVHRLACYETLLPGQWPALSKRAGSPDYRSAVMSNLDPDRVPAIYDAASVSTVVRAVKQRRAAQAPVVEVRENPDALPRAYLVGAFEVVAGDVALDRLVRGNVDLRRSVLLDGEPEPRLELKPGAAPGDAIPAEIVAFAPERGEIEARSPGEALLVLTDTHAPGWIASVNGEETPIYKANGLFRAVQVPGGVSRVVFQYAPTSLRVGAGVSLLCALLAAAVWARARPQRADPAAVLSP